MTDVGNQTKGDRSMRITIYEQEVFGRVQYRTMRDDGRLLFDRIQTDFSSLEEAKNAIVNDFRRRQDGPLEVHLEPLDRQANGRNRRRLLVASGDWRDEVVKGTTKGGF